MTLVLTVLGSSGMYATAERAASGYLLEVAGRLLWLDAGGGSWRNLLASADYRDLDGVVLTHRHPDHVIDVLMGYHARMYGEPEPRPPIPLWAPAEALEALTSFSPGLAESFGLTEVGEGSVLELDGARISFTRMAHPPETVGVRVEAGGAVLAYSADSGPEANFESLAGGASLFVCEATFQDCDELWSGHLRASQAGEIAARVGARRLLLTHLPPGRDHRRSLEEASAVSGDCEVGLASDGLRVEVGG